MEKKRIIVGIAIAVGVSALVFGLAFLKMLHDFAPHINH